MLYFHARHHSTLRRHQWKSRGRRCYPRYPRLGPRVSVRWVEMATKCWCTLQKTNIAIGGWKMDPDWRCISYWQLGDSIAMLVYWRVGGRSCHLPFLPQSWFSGQLHQWKEITNGDWRYTHLSLSHDYGRSCSKWSNHGVRKSPIPGVVGPLSKWPYMTNKCGLVTNYLLTGMII